MTITCRQYNHSDDSQAISEFLTAYHQPGNRDGNWLEPAWEYMHGHPALDTSALGQIGIWEDGVKIVAVATYESRLGEAFFQFHPAYRCLREEMLDYAEVNLCRISSKDGIRHLGAFINNFDKEFLDLVQRRGYGKDEAETRSMCCWEIPDPFPPIILPAGFRLTSLAEECDWAKVHRILWRGFDHPGEPPTGEDELESRRRMFDTPKARRDLKIAVTAPNGDFSAFCGMFIEPVNQFCYVEPVATDPNYRRMGLGKAAVLEGIRRCALLGAKMAYVGNDLPIYRSIGFQPVFYSECWVKRW